MRYCLLIILLGIVLSGCYNPKEHERLQQIEPKLSYVELGTLRHFIDRYASADFLLVITGAIKGRKEAPSELEFPFCDIKPLLKYLSTSHDASSVAISKKLLQKMPPDCPRTLAAPSSVNQATLIVPLDLKVLEKLREAAKDCNKAKVLIINKGAHIKKQEAESIIYECEFFKLQQEIQK